MTPWRDRTARPLRRKYRARFRWLSPLPPATSRIAGPSGNVMGPSFWGLRSIRPWRSGHGEERLGMAAVRNGWSKTYWPPDVIDWPEWRPEGEREC